MLGTEVGRPAGAPLSVLCLGAHSDDIEIGCGGALMELAHARPGSAVHWVVFSADEQREREARASARDFVGGRCTVEVIVHRFRESYFPWLGDEIKHAFAELRRSVDPDMVFTHRRDDEHQDHRTIAGLTWNHFRDHLVLEYEIPKYEGDLGQPNTFVPLRTETAERKVELLVEHFGSQRDKRWFRPETFRATMALRAVECNAESGWAEGFHTRKTRLEWS